MAQRVNERPNRGHPQTDVVTCYRDRVVARLLDTPPGMRDEHAPWTWSVTSPYLPPHVRPGSGLAATREEGEAEILKVWARWVAMWRAEPKPEHPAWHGDLPR